MGDSRIASYSGDSIDISNEQYTWPIPAGTLSVKPAINENAHPVYAC